MARNIVKKSVSRGFVNNTILECLLNGDKYGYEIIKEIEEATNGKVVLKQPSLYSSLRRFETKGYISSYWGDSDIGGRRHYYTLTDSGKEYFYKVTRHPELADKDDDLLEEEDAKQDDTDNQTEEYQLDTTENYEEIPVISDSYVSSFKDFDVQSKMDELLGEDTQENTEDKQPYNLYNTLNKTEEEVEYIKEQQESIQEEIVEQPQEPEPVYYMKDEQLTDNVTTEENTFIQQGMDEIKPDFEIKQKPKQTVSVDELKNRALNENVRSYENSPAPKSNLTQTTEGLYKQEDLFTIEEEKRNKRNAIVVDENGITHSSENYIATKPSKIFDNVGDRIEVNDYIVPTKLKQPEANNAAVQQDLTDKQEQNDVNYKLILKNLYSDEEEEKDDAVEQEPVEQIETPQVEQPVAQAKPVYNQKPYEISYKPYAPSVKQKEYDFILINKALAILGVVLFAFIVLQTSALLIIFNVRELIQKSDYIYYILGYVLAVVILASMCLPYLIFPTKRKMQKYNFNFSLILGVLATLTMTVFIYAVNAFAGLTVNNVNSYLSSLILPIILSINFVIAPIAYKLITKNKNLY